MRYLVILLLAGCTSSGMVTYEWTKEGAAQGELDRDYKVCEKEYIDQAGAFQGPIPAARYTTVCMRKKGWQPPK